MYNRKRGSDKRSKQSEGQRKEELPSKLVSLALCGVKTIVALSILAYSAYWKERQLAGGKEERKNRYRRSKHSKGRRKED